MADRTHDCPGGCGHQVFTHLFACRADWFRLPLDYRRAITSNYRTHPTNHLAAMAAAMEWYRANPREARRG